MESSISPGVFFQNTIIAGHVDTRFNTLLGLWVITIRDCAGILSSKNNNLIRNVDNCTVDGNRRCDPQLGPLQNNGSLTPTPALLAGSPAIDDGNPGGCRDQSSALLLRDVRGRSLDG